MKLTPPQKQIKKKCETVLDLSGAKLGKEYYYNSIVFCLIDAIFSIGARYACARNAVRRYCERFDLLPIHFDAGAAPLDSHTVTDYFSNIKPYGGPDFGAQPIFGNLQRVSPDNDAPRKAAAVYEAACVLKKHGINSLKDIKGRLGKLEELERDFRSVPGQGSGVSFNYFLMLAGDDKVMKIDRWLQRFADDATSPKRNRNAKELYVDYLAVCGALNESGYPHLTPRLLDYRIWEYEANADKAEKTSCSCSFKKRL